MRSDLIRAQLFRAKVLSRKLCAKSVAGVIARDVAVSAARGLAVCVKRGLAVRVAVSAALVLASSGSVAFAADSDWVEEGVSEFNIRQTQNENSPERTTPGSRAKPFRTQPYQFDPSQTAPSRTQQFQTPRSNNPVAGDDVMGEPGSFIPPEDIPVGDVSDTGGVELGPDGRPRKTRAPLEAGISTWGQNNDGMSTGFDGRAEQILRQAPLLATPKIISADPKQFKAWLSATHPGVLENATKDQIVEIKGEWDDCAHALRTFGLPYTRVTPKKLAETNLDNAKIIIVNCEGHLPMDAITSLRRFVAMGGSLLTTDWALQNVVEKAFPKTIRWHQGYYTDGAQNRITDAVVVSRDPELTAGTPPVGHWQLVKKSQIVQIINPDDVLVLARSRSMREDPTMLGILAVTFKYGNGHVMHLVGHFDNNSELAFNTAIPDPAPGLGFSMRQALAANFIANALKQDAPNAHAQTAKDQPQKRAGD